MSKWLKVVVAAVFLMGTVGISFAADQQAPAQPAAQPAPAVQQQAPAQPAQPAAPPASAPKEMKKDEKAAAPEKKEAAPKKVTKKAKAAEAAAPVNINTATEKDLEKLPGIGKVLAKRIVEYRTKNGPFSAPEDLMKVKGITKKKFEAIKSHVVVQ
ncbi:MAG: helix-hairpin-helix domain-containing protein [Thermodesulforhabdaceae bacterium]